MVAYIPPSPNLRGSNEKGETIIDDFIAADIFSAEFLYTINVYCKDVNSNYDHIIRCGYKHKVSTYMH